MATIGNYELILVLKASEPKVLEAAMSDAAIPKNYSSDAEDLDQSRKP